MKNYKGITYLQNAVEIIISCRLKVKWEKFVQVIQALVYFHIPLLCPLQLLFVVQPINAWKMYQTQDWRHER